MSQDGTPIPPLTAWNCRGTTAPPAPQSLARQLHAPTKRQPGAGGGGGDGREESWADSASLPREVSVVGKGWNGKPRAR